MLDKAYFIIYLPSAYHPEWRGNKLAEEPHMFTIPASLQERFEAKMRDSDVPEQVHLHYRRWLRFYLDFCLRYHTSSNRQESPQLFLQKLRDKKQADWQLPQGCKI
jgi:hypothetical protein